MNQNKILLKPLYYQVQCNNHLDLLKKIILQFILGLQLEQKHSFKNQSLV